MLHRSGHRRKCDRPGNKRGCKEMRKLSRHVVPGFTVLALVATWAAAQERASMSAPVIRSTAEELIISARFEDFVADRSYRIGFGAVDKAPEMTLELMLGDEPVSLEAQDFVQGNTSAWWRVEHVNARGYFLKGEDLPEEGGALVLRVRLNRSEAEKYDRLFIFVARDYGNDRWYLEDGTVIEKSDW